MAQTREQRRARRHAGKPPDLFTLLFDDLADELTALPGDAWLGDPLHGTGTVSLAERLAQLTAARAALTREEDQDEEVPG